MFQSFRGHGVSVMIWNVQKNRLIIYLSFYMDIAHYRHFVKSITVKIILSPQVTYLAIIVFRFTIYTGFAALLDILQTICYSYKKQFYTCFSSLFQIRLCTIAKGMSHYVRRVQQHKQTGNIREFNASLTGGRKTA